MNLSKIKFLVVDDDTDARQTVVDFLKSAGCNDITEFKNGKQALEAIKKGTFEFVISDWDMPELDGLALLKEVRAIPEFAKLPFLIVTAPISNEQLKVKDAAIEGVDAYLIKPFRARVLIQKIRDVMYDRLEASKKEVIVVDDDDEVRTFLIDALKELGYTPISDFNNATDAYEYLEKHFASVALVISDWEMPNMTGIEFLHKIRVSKKFAHTPFVIITSQSSVDALKLQQAIEAEVDSYLMKPFRLEALETKIKLVLAKAKIDLAIARRLESAAAAMEAGDLEDAEADYKHVESLSPKNVDSLLGIAAVEMSRGSPKSVNKAITYFEKAIECNPRYDRSHLELALAYENLRSIDRSIAVLKDALLKCFPLDRIHFHLGRLLLDRGKREEAVPNLEKAFELNPKLTQANDLLKIAKENPRKKK
jgi:two-component system chemotaxis response regulator CheY